MTTDSMTTEQTEQRTEQIDYLEIFPPGMPPHRIRRGPTAAYQVVGYTVTVTKHVVPDDPGAIEPGYYDVIVRRTRPHHRVDDVGYQAVPLHQVFHTIEEGAIFLGMDTMGARELARASVYDLPRDGKDNW